MEQIPSWEADSRSTSQETHNHLSKQVEFIVSHLNPIQTLTPNFFKYSF
jgi:hypothetical protein